MTSTSTTSPAADAYTLVWEDDFNGNGAVDDSKWLNKEQYDGGGNDEWQNYVGSEENAYVSDGTLKVKAIRRDNGGKSYTSGKLESKEAWLYGKFEVYARLPNGITPGTWPAIWMLPRDWDYGNWPDSGEIDIMEHVGHDVGIVHGTVHTGAYNHMKGTQRGGKTKADVTQWHKYSTEWTPDVLRFLIDDVEYQTFWKESCTDKQKWPFDKPFFLILNMAVGGTWGGCCGVNKGDVYNSPDWHDGEVMEVDWVKVYQKQQPTGECSLPCQDATPGSECHDSVLWAMDEGVHKNPQWYPGLSATSSFSEFQQVLHEGGHGGCQAPCSSDGGSEGDGGGWKRRLVSLCHTATPGEKCYDDVTWAKDKGIFEHPEWYPGLDATSTFTDFQQHLYSNELSDCKQPCGRRLAESSSSELVVV